MTFAAWHGACFGAWTARHLVISAPGSAASTGMSSPPLPWFQIQTTATHLSMATFSPPSRAATFLRTCRICRSSKRQTGQQLCCVAPDMTRSKQQPADKPRLWCTHLVRRCCRRFKEINQIEYMAVQRLPAAAAPAAAACQVGGQL